MQKTFIRINVDVITATCLHTYVRLKLKTLLNDCAWLNCYPCDPFLTCEFKVEICNFSIWLWHFSTKVVVFNQFFSFVIRLFRSTRDPTITAVLPITPLSLCHSLSQPLSAPSEFRSHASPIFFTWIIKYYWLCRAIQLIVLYKYRSSMINGHFSDFIEICWSRGPIIRLHLYHIGCEEVHIIMKHVKNFNFFLHHIQE